MSRYIDRLFSFIPLYRLVEVAGRVGVVLVALSSAGAASAQAWSTPRPSAPCATASYPNASCAAPSCQSGSGNCYGQINAAALAAPPCGMCSYARIWLKPGCVPPSFCKYRCCDCTHIWDGYCNQQSEKLNRQLARQLYYLQKEHAARGWPWYGGCCSQYTCPGFGPGAMGYGANGACASGPGMMGQGAMAGGPCPDGMPCEREGRAEVISDEAVEEGPVEPADSPTLSPVPAEPSSRHIMPLPPIEKTESGKTDAA